MYIHTLQLVLCLVIYQVLHAFPRTNGHIHFSLMSTSCKQKSSAITELQDEGIDDSGLGDLSILCEVMFIPDTPYQLL